jgi:hypothetical protein
LVLGFVVGELTARLACGKPPQSAVFGREKWWEKKELGGFSVS